MKFVALLILLLCCCCCNARETFNMLDDYHLMGEEMSVVKLPVVHDHYIDVIVGNPGKDLRLRVSWGSNTSLVLFSSPDEISTTYGENPDTVLVYMGSTLVRLGYRVDARLWDRRVDVLYDGILGMGYWSDIWRYWSKATLSSHKLVLGAYDETVSRVSYSPFHMIFDRLNPYINVTVHQRNYSLVFDPSSVYSYFPRELYRNITDCDFEIKHLHMEIDDGDIKERLISGFDRSLIRHKSRSDDNLIVLGEQFIHSFVLYYDAVTRKQVVMASYDFFAEGRAQPLYSYFCMFVYFLLSVFWLGVVLTHEAHELSSRKPSDLHNHPRATLFSMIELYVYTSGVLVLFAESVGFARYRTMAFFIGSGDHVGYYVVFIVAMYATVLVGFAVALYAYSTMHFLSVRRIFVETTTFGLWWLATLHWRSIFAIYSLVVVASVYSVLQSLQFFMALLTQHGALTLISFFYASMSIAFLVAYNILPIVNYYYYGFDDIAYSVMVIMFFVYILPMLGVLLNYPMAIVQNSIVEVQQTINDFIASVDGDDDFSSKESDDDDEIELSKNSSLSRRQALLHLHSCQS